MSLPRMSFHIGDYLKDTGHLSTIQHGAYLLLIMHYWTTGGLPDDARQLAKISRLPMEIWTRHRETLQLFFHDGWKHKRIDRELAEALENYKKKVEAGRAGGQASRRANVEQPLSKRRADVKQTSTNPNPNHLRKRSDASILKEAKNGASGPVRIHYNDPQWDAWERYLRKTTGKGSPQDRNFSWIFPSLWPPGHPGAP